MLEQCVCLGGKSWSPYRSYSAYTYNTSHYDQLEWPRTAWQKPSPHVPYQAGLRKDIFLIFTASTTAFPNILHYMPRGITVYTRSSGISTVIKCPYFQTGLGLGSFFVVGSAKGIKTGHPPDMRQSLLLQGCPPALASP